jgi:hypothetical protein
VRLHDVLLEVGMHSVSLQTSYGALRVLLSNRGEKQARLDRTHDM